MNHKLKNIEKNNNNNIQLLKKKLNMFNFLFEKLKR